MTTALTIARDWVEAHYCTENGNVHTVGIGKKIRGGQVTNEDAILVYVGEKLSAQAMVAQNIKPVPSVVHTAHGDVLTDVIEMPPPSICRLMLGDVHAVVCAEGISDWQRCHDAPVPSGVQIAPAASWVGTLGGFPVRLSDGLLCVMTNWHVAVVGQGAVGAPIYQPSRSRLIGRLASWRPIAPNKTITMDVALVNMVSRKYSAPFAGRNLFQLGKATTTAKSPTVGMRVSKTGRTTGVVHGRVEAIGATSYVNYGSFTAKLKMVFVVRGDGGADFSRPGDSGSPIVEKDILNPVGLLFAGGGGTTIGCEVARVLNWCGGVLV